ncbi:MAG: phenylalanine--tRNA ligase subunit beta [Brevinematales bacterium]|nr:phenylalanine--tRNA ligase subunit beta [Brevinematales bacterium]
MKVTYNWLKEFVNFKNSPEEIGQILTSMGPEVVSIKPVGISTQNANNIILTKVLEVKKHPNADNLKIVIIDYNKKQVITNSPNISKDDYVIYAKTDTHLPNGFMVKKVNIKSIESEGMLLAKEHLNLEEKSSDIFILGKDKKKAEFLFNIYCEEDYILEVELTANRSDCLSVLGIAREISAALNLPINIPLPTIESNLEEIPVVEVIDDENCPRYSARVLRDVKVSESPEWIKRKLELCGIRAINNIVDATNYVLLELGHPMHAFDLKLLEGEKVVIRKAFKNEIITALDGVKYELSNEMLVIADDKKPVAIAGIMGGEYSGVIADTKSILLESAYFNPLLIRRTAKKLGLRTESSYRFERGTDWEITTKAIERATEIIMLTCSPKISKIRDEYNNVFKDRIIKVRADFVSEKIGLSFSLKDLELFLKRLHFTIVSKEKDFLEVKIPSFRADVSRQIDIVEEISRLYGYNNIPQNNFKPPVVVKNLGFKKDIYWLIRESLITYGFTETYNYSFCGEEDVKTFLLDQNEMIKLQNPMSSDISLLRPYLFPNLLKTLDYNIKSVYKNDLRLFEYGRTFKKQNNKMIEKKVFCGVMYGKNYDYYNISGVVEGLLDKVGKKRIDYEKIELPFLHPINSGKIKFDGKEVGIVGEIHPDVRERLDIKNPVYVFELEIENLADYLEKAIKVQKFSKLPPVTRDLSIVVNKNVIARGIMNEISLSSELIKDVEFKDIFESPQIGVENKSLTFSITFSHPERTLTDEEVNIIVEEIIKRLKAKFNAELR